MPILKPNFFIIGAPKCGTTSMAEWLACHPDIYMSPDKEPHFFNSDYTPGRKRSLASYEALYARASSDTKVLGEASTGYLFSEAAVKNIDSYSPLSKFLVLIRNPVEMAISLHSQRLRELYEDVESFERAWALQNCRQHDPRLLPKYCPDMKLLQYGHICSLGTHLERLYNAVDKARILVLVLDDIQKNPRVEYLKVLNFISVEDDGRVDFPVYNRARQLRWPVVIKLMKHFSRVRTLLNVPRPRTGILAGIKALSERDVDRPEIGAALRQELQSYFSLEIAKISVILNRDFSYWLD